MSAHGWYIMPRGWMLSDDFKPEPFTEREAFQWSVEKAAYVPHSAWFNGMQIPVDRGQFVTSIRDMARKFGWGEKRVRGFIQRMCRKGRWARQTAQAGAQSPTILTVCNYDQHQHRGAGKGTDKGAVGGASGAHSGRIADTEENEDKKKGKESKASPYSIDTSQIEAAVSIWNEAATRRGWRLVHTDLAETRRKKLRTLLRRFGLDAWRSAVLRAENSSWLGGAEPPGWFRFDFLLHQDKFQNILEGSYDRPMLGGPPQRGSAWLTLLEDPNYCGR